MNLAVTQQVDVIKDFWDWVALLAGLGGFFAAVVAIVLARRAQKTATSAVTAERRRVFELEILRDLMRDLDEGKLAGRVFERPSALLNYKHRLGLLSSKLPFWMQVMNITSTRAMIDALRAGEAFSAAEQERSLIAVDRRQIVPERDRSRSIADILESVAGSREVEVIRLLEQAAVQGSDADLLDIVRQGQNTFADMPPVRTRDGETITEGFEPWKARADNLDQSIREMEKKMVKLNDRMTQLRREARLELEQRLAYDVQQEIWARVEAEDRQA